MPSRCATRRFWLQNSPEASTSTTAVCTAIETSSPPPISRPLSFDLRMLAKKYLALPLWTMSKSVPRTTAIAISTR